MELRSSDDYAFLFSLSALPLSGVVSILLELAAIKALSLPYKPRTRPLFFRNGASSHFARMGLGSKSGIEGPREKSR
jgi:hypothetical protein